MDSRQLQSQRNGIENDDHIKLPLVYIREMQNTADVGIKASTEAVVDRRLDVNDRNEI